MLLLAEIVITLVFSSLGACLGWWVGSRLWDLFHPVRRVYCEEAFGSLWPDSELRRAELDGITGLSVPQIKEEIAQRFETAEMIIQKVKTGDFGPDDDAEVRRLIEEIDLFEDVVWEKEGSCRS